jgi:hypothetical protein
MPASIDDTRSMLRQMTTCASTYQAAATMYRNDAKIRDLFEMTLQTAPVRRVIERVDESTLRADAEVGVDAGPLIGLLLRLKAGVTGSTIRSETVKTIEEDIETPHLLAFAESALRASGNITDSPAAEGSRLQYFRFEGGLRPFLGDAVRSKLLPLFGADGADVVTDRLDAFAKLNSQTSFVYATNEPRPCASILIAPPRPDLEIVGDSWACYPEGEGVTRIYFGRFADETDGVRFLNMHYVLDTWPSSSEDASATSN